MIALSRSPNKAKRAQLRAIWSAMSSSWSCSSRRISRKSPTTSHESCLRSTSQTWHTSRRPFGTRCWRSWLICATYRRSCLKRIKSRTLTRCLASFWRPITTRTNHSLSSTSCESLCTSQRRSTTTTCSSSLKIFRQCWTRYRVILKSTCDRKTMT